MGQAGGSSMVLDGLASRVSAGAGVEAVAATRNPRTPLTVIYIAGDGRSGSTLLDRLIGACDGAFSCGELANLLNAVQSGEELCACGERAPACRFWAEVMRRWRGAVAHFEPDEYRRLQQRHERL